MITPGYLLAAAGLGRVGRGGGPHPQSRFTTGGGRKGEGGYRVNVKHAKRFCSYREIQHVSLFCTFVHFLNISPCY